MYKKVVQLPKYDVNINSMVISENDSKIDVSLPFLYSTNIQLKNGYLIGNIINKNYKEPGLFSIESEILNSGKIEVIDYQFDANYLLVLIHLIVQTGAIYGISKTAIDKILNDRVQRDAR